MATKNPITGDELISRAPTDEYKSGWDRIFGNRKVPVVCPACGERRAECDKCAQGACGGCDQCDSEGGCV